MKKQKTGWKLLLVLTMLVMCVGCGAKKNTSGSVSMYDLRTAMEALEQLQMQGRKIGVISHVQEMSERISVQVQVHKKVNGKSVLSVVG